MQLLRTILPNIPKHELDDMPSGSLYPIMEGISSSSVLFVAAELGNTVFVNELIHHYPQLVVELNDNKQSIFHIAVLHRHLGIYNLLHGIGSIKDSIINLEDKNGNNLLHFVGIRKEPLMDSQSQYLQGPAVHMERERQWFKVSIFSLCVFSFSQMQLTLDLVFVQNTFFQFVICKMHVKGKKMCLELRF